MITPTFSVRWNWAANEPARTIAATFERNTNLISTHQSACTFMKWSSATAIGPLTECRMVSGSTPC